MERNPDTVRQRASNEDLPIHSACRNGATISLAAIHFLVDQDPAALQLPGGIKGGLHIFVASVALDRHSKLCNRWHTQEELERLAFCHYTSC